jgi:L-amino acid N-acyltransferase YncA
MDDQFDSIGNAAGCAGHPLDLRAGGPHLSRLLRVGPSRRTGDAGADSDDPRVVSVARARGRGRVAAYAYASRFHARPAYRWSVEVSVYVDGNHRGRGAGNALLRSLLRELDRCGFINAFAGVTLPNPSSVRLFEGLGFEQVAHYRDVGFKLGAWRDVGWWQKRLRDPPRSPSEPIS